MLPGDQVPPGHDWIARRFAELERRIEEMGAARSAEATTVGGGGITLKAGAELHVQHPNGQDVLEVSADDQGIYTIRMRRNDGSLVFETATTVLESQYFALHDTIGHIIFSDDAVSAQGLARPYLQWRALPTAELGTIPASGRTTSATFVALWTVVGEKQHPKLRIDLHTRTDATTTGEVRVRDPNTGAVLTGPHVIPAGDNNRRLYDCSVAGGFSEIKNIDVELRRTAGTGEVQAYVMMAEGIQS